MIVNCVAYRAGKSLGNIPVDDISEVLKEPETFVWLGMHEPDTQLLRKTQEEFSLHELAIEDALHAHQRPKLETYADSLFIVVDTAQLVNDEVQFGETHLFVGQELHRHHPPRLVGELRTCSPEVRDRAQRLGLGPGYGLIRSSISSWTTTSRSPSGCRPASRSWSRRSSRSPSIASRSASCTS